jgi:hypothetical protein
VRAAVVVRTNRGRTFTWETAATADAQGRFRLRVPYPNTPATAFSTGTEGPYRLHAWGREGEVRFTEEEIESGAVKRITLERAPAISGEVPPDAEHAPGRARGERVGEAFHRVRVDHDNDLDPSVQLRAGDDHRGPVGVEQRPHVGEIHAGAKKN